jgi:hypothetical protein
VLGPDALEVLRGGLRARDVADRCLEEVMRDGPTYRNEDTGLVKSHPAASLAQSFLSEFRAAMRDLHLPAEG